MVAKSPAPMSSSNESRINLSICGLTRISLELVPSCLDLLNLLQARPERTNLFFELSRLVALFLNHFFLRLRDEVRVAELLLHARKLILDLADLFSQSGVFLV